MVSSRSKIARHMHSYWTPACTCTQRAWHTARASLVSVPYDCSFVMHMHMSTALLAYIAFAHLPVRRFV